MALASTTIKRPVEEVFAVVSDATNHPKWRSTLLSVTKTSEGPTGMGTTYRGTGKMFGRHQDTEFTVTEFDVNRTFAVAATKPFPLTITIALEPTTEGTRLDMVADAEPGGFFKLAQPLMMAIGGRRNQSDLEKLRDLMEAKAL